MEQCSSCRAIGPIRMEHTESQNKYKPADEYTQKMRVVCISISMKGHLAAVLSTFSLLFLQSSLALNVSDITQCPKLAPRESPPANVSDLRIDDISVVGALGDR